MRRFSLLLCLASLSAAAQELNGGASWSGWSLLGNSQAVGVYASDSRRTDFEVYFTSFVFNAATMSASGSVGNPSSDFGTGSFLDGDRIMGVGVRWAPGQAGMDNVAFLSVDRNGTGPFQPSRSLPDAGGDGLTQITSTVGGTGAVSIETVGYSSNENSVSSWQMRDPSMASGVLIFPTGTQNFLRVTNPFWGQSFGSLDRDQFRRALPFRVLGTNADGGQDLRSFQWFIDSSAFDRAGAQYSAPSQSFRPGWSFSLTVQSSGGLWTSVVGQNLPWLGVSVADAGVADAGVADAGAVDAGVVDAGVVDAGVVDAGVAVAGVVDAGVVDAGVVDAGVADAGVADAGVADAGVDDAGVADAGVADREPGFYLVGCGCRGGGAGFSWLGLVLLLVTIPSVRRRTRST